MQKREVIQAWGRILSGRRPSLSLEITRECPLHCPGCYAYDAAHLGGNGVTLRDLHDLKGQALVDRVVAIVDERKPLHVSLVGGDPLVRYRELEQMVPQILARGAHVQIVTSAFRDLPAEWASMERLNVVVSVDGLAPEHDERRAPATYARILKTIAGSRVTIHCTVTGQMMKRRGYLDEFLAFWTPMPEISRVWFSIFTPQRGDDLPEMLTAGERARLIAEMLELRRKYRKLEMPEALIREFANPPRNPGDCIFAMTTTSLSADLTTQIGPCQFGGDPDCSACGCIASMGLAAISNHRLAGLIPVRALVRASMAVGRLVGTEPAAPAGPGAGPLIQLG